MLKVTEDGKKVLNQLLPEERENPYKLTDAGNSELFADMLRGRYLYIPEQRSWYRYNGKIWEEDINNHIVQDIIRCLRQAQKDALSIIDDDKRSKTIKWLLSSESQAKISAALKLTSTIPFMTARINQFDSDDMLLCVQNGTVDLRTGKLQPHKKDDYITKLCNVSYNPKSKSKLFEAFLNEITEGSKEKQRYLQKLCGYCCTGSIVEQEFYQAKGSGGNGKTVLFEVIKHCLGDYAITASPDILMAKDMGTIPNDVARLRGARMVLMSEPDPGKRFSDNAVKSLTGGDTIIARFLHKEYFEFSMKGKLIMLTNHEIKTLGTDYGLWRRMVTVPFNYQVPPEKRDKRLQKKLIDEAGAVLSWVIEGCLLWQREGLQQPEELKQAKEEYRRSQDAVGLFLEDCCHEGNQLRISASSLYKAYVDWCEVNGEYCLSQRKFGSRLREKGYVCEKNGIYYWLFLDLLDLLDKKQINYNKKNYIGDLPETSPASPVSPELKNNLYRGVV